MSERVAWSCSRSSDCTGVVAAALSCSSSAAMCVALSSRSVASCARKACTSCCALRLPPPTKEASPASSSSSSSPVKLLRSPPIASVMLAENCARSASSSSSGEEAACVSPPEGCGGAFPPEVAGALRDSTSALPFWPSCSSSSSPVSMPGPSPKSSRAVVARSAADLSPEFQVSDASARVLPRSNPDQPHDSSAMPQVCSVGGALSCLSHVALPSGVVLKRARNAASPASKQANSVQWLKRGCA